MQAGLPTLLALVLFAVPSQALPPARYLALKLEADSMWASGNRAGALPLYETLVAANPADGELKLRLARALFAAERKEEGVSQLELAFDSGFGSKPSMAWTIAAERTARGDTTGALYWIERALGAGWEDRSRLKHEDAFRSLHTNPRFRELAGYAPDAIKGREAGWSHDLDFFILEAQRLHAGPHRPAWSTEFTEAVEALKRQVPTLSDAGVAIELQKIVSLWMADGHSVVYPIPTERVQFAGMLPVSFYVMKDGLFVVAADAPHEDLVGMRVDRIGEQPTDLVLAELTGIVSRDNEHGLLGIGPLYLRSPDILHGIGVLKEPGPVPLRLVDRKGASREVSLTPGPPRSLNQALEPPPGKTAPAWLARAHENYWLASLPGIDAVYVQFNQVQDSEGGPTLIEFASNVKDTLTRTKASHLVIDVRHNNGGNNFLLRPVVSLVAWHELAETGHRTFVITGRNTFSACQNFVNQLERHTGAIFVGEPSGGRPNFSGESNDLELPWSGLRFSISSRWFQDSFPGDQRPYIPVSMPVQLSSEDWWQGRDPVMEALSDYLRTPARK